MDKKKILLLTNHLYGGGVDRVAVDIANGLDKDRFDVTLMILFRFAPENFRLDPRVRLVKVFGGYFKGLSSLLRRLPPRFLYRRLIRETYDYEVAFQAGIPTWLLSQSPSGAVKYAWMHGLDMDHAQEHNRFDRVVFVSEEVKDTFAPLVRPSGPADGVLQSFGLADNPGKGRGAFAAGARRNPAGGGYAGPVLGGTPESRKGIPAAASMPQKAPGGGASPPPVAGGRGRGAGGPGKG